MGIDGTTGINRQALFSSETEDYRSPLEPDVDSDVMLRAVDYIRKADILIIGGTSLAVYPAASLIDYYRGNKLVLVNKSETPADGRADLVIHEPIGEVFAQL